MIDASAEAWRTIAGRPGTDILIVADHAANAVPADIDLGIPPALLDRHIAIDIGVAALAEALCAATGCGAVLGGVSRLVCDCNREPDADGLVPAASDGVAIPGNAIDASARAARIARVFDPYHRAVADGIADLHPRLLVSLHSFTPQLESRPDEARPWQVGILYNHDDRAARIAIPLLDRAGVATGDNQPYSGRVLNATMNRHGEATGRPYLGIEVRQDLIADPAGVARWCAVLAPVIVATRDALAKGGHDGDERLS